MTKRIFSTPIDNTSDIGFRAWTTELHDELAAAGLVKTADTGQLAVPVVAPRPTVSATAAGYWIFRFDDSLAGAAPIYIKVEVGSASTAGLAPAIWITVGTGSNGAGTLSGVVLSREFNSAPTGTGAGTSPGGPPYPSYINVDEGFFGFCWKAGSVTGTIPRSYLFICRTVDDGGNPTPEGYFMARRVGSVHDIEGVSGTWAGYAARDTAANWSVVPMGLNSSSVGSDYQCFKVYGAFPSVRVVPQLVGVVSSELALGSLTGPVEIMDGVVSDFISLSGAGANRVTITHNTNYSYAMKWD